MRIDLLPKTRKGKLARIVEECGEVIKAYGKLKRFGAYATDPKTQIKYNNVRKLNEEILHLQHAIKEYQK